MYIKIRNAFSSKNQKIAVSLMRRLWNFKLVSICVFLLCLSCSNKNEEDVEIKSLEGTKWKLAGIVDTETGVLKELEPKDCTGCYTLIFDTDTTAQGRSSGNLVIISGLNPFRFHLMTYAGEYPDGFFYTGAMYSVKSYAYNRNALKFYYDNNKFYLIFKPWEP